MKLVVFSAADKEYAIDIKSVREVIRMREPVPIPDAADFVEGVISLRGEVIALVNLRKKLKLEKSERDAASRILITHVNSHLMGVVVDKVIGVISFEEGDITPPDKVLKEVEYLIGVGKKGERLILILNIEKLLTSKEKIGIKTVREKVEIRKKINE